MPPAGVESDDELPAPHSPPAAAVPAHKKVATTTRDTQTLASSNRILVRPLTKTTSKYLLGTITSGIEDMIVENMDKAGKTNKSKIITYSKLNCG